MKTKDNICFYNISREDAQKITGIAGYSQYNFFYGSNLEKLEKIHAEDHLSLVIIYDNLLTSAKKELSDFCNQNLISVLVLNKNISRIYNHASLTNAKYLMYLIKTLCRLSWVSRLNLERTEETSIQDNYNQTIKLINEVDTHTKDHVENVARYAKVLGEKLELNRKDLKKLISASLLHDVGKTIIPKEILTSPNKLSEEEYAIVKLHTTMTDKLIADEYKELKPIIKYHHEKYDGTGYPDGLKGEQIPLLSRIITVLDSFDAMTSQRIYNEPVTKKQALEILKKDANTHFDPKIVEVFIEILENEK